MRKYERKNGEREKLQSGKVGRADEKRNRKTFALEERKPIVSKYKRAFLFQETRADTYNSLE